MELFPEEILFISSLLYPEEQGFPNEKGLELELLEFGIEFYLATKPEFIYFSIFNDSSLASEFNDII